MKTNKAYSVRITETASYVREVEASSELQAQQIALEDHLNDEDRDSTFVSVDSRDTAVISTTS